MGVLRVAAAGHVSVRLVAVSRQRQLLSLFGLEEGVGQSDGVHSGHPRVGVELGVDVEEDGHVDLLVRVQPLLLEAETLYLVEVLSGLEGDHVVGGDADDRFVRGVFRSIKGQRRLSRNDIDLALLGSEVPLDAGVSVCVKRDFDDSLFDGAHVLHHGRVVSRHSRAPEPRRLAVESVERHGGVGKPDHSHSGRRDVREDRFVPRFPLRLVPSRAALFGSELKPHEESLTEERLRATANRAVQCPCGPGADVRL